MKGSRKAGELEAEACRAGCSGTTAQSESDLSKHGQVFQKLCETAII